MRLFALAGLIVLLLTLGNGAGASSVSVESYCPGTPCYDDYVLNGFRQTEPIVEFTYFPQGASAVQQQAFIRAVHDWGSATASNTDTSYAQAEGLPQNSLCGGYGAVVPPGTDGVNSITWGPIDGLAIGRACWSGVDECDVVMDSTWAGFQNEEATRTVALHEVGHCLGLSHSEVAAAVMAPSYSQPKQLHADDIAGFCAVYGCNGGGTSTPTPTPTVSTPTPTLTPTVTPTPLPGYKKCGWRTVGQSWVCARLPGIAHD